MIWKSVKIAAATGVGALVIGAVVFGSEVFSYARSSAGMVRTAVKDQVPIEFELRRAGDMLGEIIPEMHANIRQIAMEEVEIAALEEDITATRDRLGEERERLASLRDMLETNQTRFVLAGQRYERQHVKDELSRRLEYVKEADVMLTSKERLLNSRRDSLLAAQQMLDRTRSQKALLEDRIEGLESQHRMIQAAAVGSKLEIDSSKLAQTEKLIGDIKKRLDVAERVLAHESRFTQSLPIETVSEEELIEQVDSYLGGSDESPLVSEPQDVELGRVD